MATKTITLELDAYEKLRGSKKAGESFSEVVRRAVFPDAALTGIALLAHLKRRGPILSEQALDEIERGRNDLNVPPDDPWKQDS
jgi:hypothetical protein